MLDSKVKRLFGSRTTLLVISHPECIEFFECVGRALEINQPALFKNLRVLHSILSEPRIAFSANLENLEELHLPALQVKDFPLFNQLAKRTALKNVSIYVSDVCLPSERSVGISQTDRNDSLVFRIRNYHKLTERVRGVKEVSYEHLIYCLDHHLPPNQTEPPIELNEWRFPVGFFEKFLNIQSVRVRSEVKDEERFLWFLSRCARLTELYFEREFLTQSLLNRLPAVCRPLKVFSIGYSRSSGLDLRPVYGLKQLFVLEVRSKDGNLDSPLDLVVLFESCKYLVEVSLKHIRIQKAKLYEVYTPKESDLKGTPLPVLQHKWAAFKHEDLKSNLTTIIAECKELKKRKSSHSIW